jgi:hypothetical protein
MQGEKPEVGGGADGRAPLVIQQMKMKRGGGEVGSQAGRWAVRLKEKAIGLLELCGLREEGRKVEVGRAVSWATR